MYVCKACNHCTANFKKFCDHANSHRNLANYRFACGIEECSGNFRTFSALKSHMQWNHMGPRAISQRQNRCQHGGDLKCSIQGCDFKADSFPLLCGHLRLHIRNGKKVNCPFDGCSKYFRVRTSFATHISRKHREAYVAQPQDSQIQNKEHVQHHDDHEIIDPGLDDRDGVILDLSPDTYLKNLSLFYLKLQAKLLLPATTVQCIVEGFQEVHSSGMQYVLKKVEEKLTGLHITNEEIQKIVRELKEEDLLTIYNEGERPVHTV